MKQWTKGVYRIENKSNNRKKYYFSLRKVNELRCPTDDKIYRVTKLMLSEPITVRSFSLQQQLPVKKDLRIEQKARCFG